MKTDGRLEVGDLVISDRRVWRVGLVNSSRARLDPVTVAIKERNDWESKDVSPTGLYDTADDYELDDKDIERLTQLLERAEDEDLLDEERRLELEIRRESRAEAERIRALQSTPAHSAVFGPPDDEENDMASGVAGVPGVAAKGSLKEQNQARLAELKKKKAATAQAREEEKKAKPKAAKKAKAPKEPKPCVCGCGEMTGGFFFPGHDAVFKGKLLKIEKGDAKKEELLDADVIAKYKWVSSGLEGKVGKGQRPTTNYKGEPHSGYYVDRDAAKE